MTSPSRLRTVAVVLAGGSGSRVGLTLPKQLLKVAGRTIIEHTVEALHVCDEIDEILVVMAQDHLHDAQRLLVRDSLPKVTRVLPGGSDRSASTQAALEALGDEECNVLFHDAVRPLVSRRVVRDCVRALETHEAIDVATPSADTIVRVDGDDNIADIPDRKWLRRGQTPQGFRLSVIRRAYELAEADGRFTATDDCGVVLHYLPEVPIHVVAGDEQNMKVTYPVDLFLMDKLFQLSSHAAAPHSEAEHARRLAGKTLVVLGGSYGIGADIARLATAAGCNVVSCGRSTTGTHVERSESVEQALKSAYEQTGRIDAVVLTAAMLVKGSLTEMDPESVAHQVAVNFMAPVHVARAAHPYLAKTKGHLLFFTSSSYTRGRADYALYSSTKAAVVNLTQALADEWLADGVSVNVLNPERTRTPMRLEAFGDEPGHTLLESDAVAASALDVLVGDLTGHVFDVRLPSSSADGVDPRVPEADEIAQSLSAVETAAELDSLRTVSSTEQV